MSELNPEHIEPSEPSGEQERPVWRMYAGRSEQSGMFSDFFGHPTLVRMNGYHGEIIQVELIEDPEGPYWGWLGTNEDVPSLIQPHEIQYIIQFAYGPQRAEDTGIGRTVRLMAREVQPDDPDNSFMGV